MSVKELVRQQLKRDEGVKLKPYRCTAGKLTIGCGRNLDDRGISTDEMEYLLANDIELALSDAAKLFSNFHDLSELRQAVLVNLAFNLGYDRLAKFRKLRKAVESFDFDTAYVEMVSSLWASQVGPRATRLAKMMREG